MKEISVVIPVYNAFIWKDTIIKSVKGNLDQILEVILINDGDKDDYNKLITCLRSEFGGMIIPAFSGFRTGPAVARNIGIDMVKGEYIAFLDCDDLWMPDSLFKKIELLRVNPKAPFVYSDFTNVDVNTGNKSLNNVPFKAQAEDLLVTNFICIASVVGFAKTFKANKFLNVKHEDLDIWLHLLKQSKVPALSVGINGVVKKIGLRSVSSNKLQSMIWHTKVIYSHMKLQACLLIPFLLVLYIVNGFMKRKMSNYKPVFLGFNKLLVILRYVK